MGEIRRYDGNSYVNITLDDNQIEVNEMDNLLHFIHSHKNIYLFGKGLCGTGMKEFFDVCQFDNIRGFVTSDTFEEMLSDYHKERDGIILSLKADYYAEILPLVLDKFQLKDVLFLKEKTKQIFIKTFSQSYFNDMFWLTIPLSLHCNINCASCNMFSPLCEPENYKLKKVISDLKKIQATGIKLNKINISGGEPFLNPEIVDILVNIRDLYPDLKIVVYTNGMLIDRLSIQQLELLKKCQLEFQITEYGINTEILQNVYYKFDNLGIRYIVDYTNEKKLFYKKVIDFDKSASIYEYINCQYYTYCFALFMYDGRLYKCPMALNADNINKYSEKKLERTEEDVLDVEAVGSTQQIYDFWRSYKPMCAYCPRVSKAFTWRKSEQKIEEWT